MNLKNTGNQNFFYININSTPTNIYPENNASRFQIELMKDYSLDGEWEVGLVNCYIPRPRNFLMFDKQIYRISPDACYFAAVFHNNSKKKLLKMAMNEFTKKELAVFLSDNFSDFFDVYMDENENINLCIKNKNKNDVLQIFTSVEIMEILDFYKDIPLVHRNVREGIWSEKFTQISETLRKEKMDPTFLVGGVIKNTMEEKITLNKNIFLISVDIFYKTSKHLKTFLLFWIIKDILTYKEKNIEEAKRKEFYHSIKETW